MVRAGKDLEAEIRSFTGRHAAIVEQIDVPLDEPAIDRVVDELVGMDFFYAGLLPEFAHTDLLRLQRLNRPTSDSFTPALANPNARGLLEFMVKDRGGNPC